MQKGITVIEKTSSKECVAYELVFNSDSVYRKNRKTTKNLDYF